MDQIGPVFQSIAISATDSNLLAPQQIRVTATFTDVGRGDSPLRTPELLYTAIAPLGSGTALTAVDGKFDSPTETTSLDLAWKDFAESGTPSSIMLRARDVSGNWSDLVTQSLDLLLPPTLTEESDTGESTSDRLTLDSTPTFTGQLNPFANVALFIASDDNASFSLAGTTQANAEGNWTLTLSLPSAGRWFVYGQVTQDNVGGIRFLAPTIINLVASGFPNLVVNGTPASDQVQVLATAQGTFDVRFNGISVGNVYNITSVTMFGQAGNDNLSFTGNLPAVLYGGDGNDVLTGGSGSDYLNGGRGNNTLIGGLGSDRYLFANEVVSAIDPTNSFDIIRDPVGSSDSIDFRQNTSIQVNGIVDRNGLYAKYLTIYRTARSIRLSADTSPSSSGES